MLNKSNFTSEKIKKLQNQYKRDPALFERALFAFGLLEALSIAGLEFIFKGGTCLLLLLDKPMRLSTDIDILIKPGTDIDSYINKASEVFPFISFEEQIRSSRRKINKRHFMFFYNSPVTDELFHIILDVIYEKNYYSGTVQKAIDNILLDVEPPSIYVTVPTIDCILGDKLTAFAPHTIGIPFGIKKEMEIIKQIFDISSLVEHISNFEDVKITYRKIAELEIKNREIDNVGVNETLIDSFNAAISIISKGSLFSEDYKFLLDGMHRVKNHIFSSFSPLLIERQACKVVYLIISILINSPVFIEIDNINFYSDKLISDPIYSKLNYVKRDSLTNFAYLYESIKLFAEITHMHED